MTKDIELCGIGNGLVDIMYEVPDQELVELGLNKGEMRLVESDSQIKLLNRYEGHNVLKCSGGSAANTMIAFAALGGKAAYSTILGNDDLGKFYSDEFKELGIHISAPLVENEPTGTCFVFITPDSERTMHTSLGANEKFTEDHIDEDVIARSKWLYIEGYKFTNQLSSEGILNAVELAKKHGTKIAVTFSDKFITDFFRENLNKVVEASDLLFCNEMEAMSFTATTNTDDAFKALCTVCPNVVMTLGSKGSKIMWEGKEYDIPSYPASPVDSTGAGDMFAGAFFYGIIHTGNPNIAGHLASKAAAAVVSQYGARLAGSITDIRDTILAEIKD